MICIDTPESVGAGTVERFAATFQADYAFKNGTAPADIVLDDNPPTIDLYISGSDRTAFIQGNVTYPPPGKGYAATDGIVRDDSFSSDSFGENLTNIEVTGHARLSPDGVIVSLNGNTFGSVFKVDGLTAVGNINLKYGEAYVSGDGDPLLCNEVTGTIAFIKVLTPACRVFIPCRIWRDEEEQTMLTFSAPKDPDSTIDLKMDWSEWFPGDIITSSEWDVPTGLVSEKEATGALDAVIWLSGRPVDGSGDNLESGTIRNRVVTASGRTDDRSIEIYINEL